MLTTRMPDIIKWSHFLQVWTHTKFREKKYQRIENIYSMHKGLWPSKWLPMHYSNYWFVYVLVLDVIIIYPLFISILDNSFKFPIPFILYRYMFIVQYSLNFVWILWLHKRKKDAIPRMWYLKKKTTTTTWKCNFDQFLHLKCSNFAF